MLVTEPNAPTYEKFSMIIVPTDTRGFNIIRPVPVMGETAGGHCEIRYEDCRVPLTNLLGPRGQAFKIAQKRLGPGRIYHCMRWLGQAQRAFELMCERALCRAKTSRQHAGGKADGAELDCRFCRGDSSGASAHPQCRRES